MDIYTLGHSTRKIHQFLKILLDNEIQYIVDVRSYPTSRFVPQYNKNYLSKYLNKHGIKYEHIIELGGRRHNTSYIDTSIESRFFSSYAEHMRTQEFKNGLKKLKKIGTKYKTAIICSEAVWWRCHRRMIADRLTFDGWKVYHLGLNKMPILHEIWDIARLDKNNNIIYDQ